MDDLSDGTALRTEKPAPVVDAIVDSDAVKKAKEAMDKARVELDAIREGMYQDTLEDDERALRQLDVKHQEELAKLKANTLHTAEDTASLEAGQTAERIALIEEQGEALKAALGARGLTLEDIKIESRG